MMYQRIEIHHSYFLIGLLQKLIRCVFSLFGLEFIKELYIGIWEFSKYLHIFEDLRILSDRDILSVKDQHGHLILWEKYYIWYLIGKRHQYSSSGCMLSILYKPWNACKLHMNSNDTLCWLCAWSFIEYFTLLFPFSYVGILRHRLDVIVILILERKPGLIEVKWFAQDPKVSLKIVAYKKALIIKQFQQNFTWDAFNTAAFFLL